MFTTCSQIALISAMAFGLSACAGPITFPGYAATPLGPVTHEVTLTKPAPHSTQVDVFYTWGPYHAPNLHDRLSD